MEPWNAETTVLNQSLGKKTTTLLSPFIITILWYCITMETSTHCSWENPLSMAIFNRKLAATNPHNKKSGTPRVWSTSLPGSRLRC